MTKTNEKAKVVGLDLHCRVYDNGWWGGVKNFEEIAEGKKLEYDIIQK